MGYAVLHSQKGSASGGLGNHIDRIKGMEHNFKQADPSRINENVVYSVYQKREHLSLTEAINERILEGYKVKKAYRKDAVKFTAHVLGGSHEDMKEIFKDKRKSDAWIQANYDFISKEFGEKNIVRFNLHMDEKTPHIHAVTVPLTEDGRLSAREIIGNKTEMRSRQDRYAEAMEPFGLERGKRNTGIKHEDTKEYYGRMESAMKAGDDIDDLTVKRSFLGIETGIDKEKTIESLKSAVIAQKTALKAKDLELTQTKARLERTKENSDLTSRKYDSIISNDKAYKNAQDKRIIEVQKGILYAIKGKVESRFNLHKITPSERQELAFNTAVNKANELNAGQNIYDKAMSKEFRNELLQVVENRAEKNLDRDQGKNRGRGR